MKHLKNKNQFIKESYFSDLGDKLQNTKDDVIRNINQTISDKADGKFSKSMFKKGAEMGGFPKGEMEKFISYIKSNCVGEIITLEKIKELVAPMLGFGMGLSADRASSTAVPTGNINFVDLVSELVYDEMEERGILDCTSDIQDEDFLEDEDFGNEYDDDFLDIDEDDVYESKKIKSIRSKKVILPKIRRK